MPQDRPQPGRGLGFGTRSGRLLLQLLACLQQRLLDDARQVDAVPHPGSTCSLASRSRYARNRSRSSAERTAGAALVDSRGWDMSL